jgi:hypothetical protein
VGSRPLCKLQKGCTRLAAASDMVYQLLAHGRWFSLASSTTKTGRHDIAEILLKVALSTNKFINQIHIDTVLFLEDDAKFLMLVLFLAHLTKDNVSFCHHLASVVR